MRLTSIMSRRRETDQAGPEGLKGLDDDSSVAICGLVVHRQHRAVNAISLTLKDETGHPSAIM